MLQSPTRSVPASRTGRRPQAARTRQARIACAVALAAALAVGLGTGSAQAQAWPAKPIRLVVPYPTGGGADLATRTVAEGLTAQLGQQVLVDNRGGAAGIVGTDWVAKSAQDGYTLLLAPDVLFTTYPFLYAKLPYAFRDFAPIAVTTYLSMAIFAHPSVQANNLRELVAQLKAKPQSLPYGTPGTGTPMHLAGELLNQLGNLTLVHIPYKGGGPAATDLLGGQLPLAIVGVSSGVQHAKAGKLKALAVLDARRVPAMPDVPTVAESGFPNYEVTTWFGVYAPAGTPDAIVQRLSTEIAKTLQIPALRERLAAGGQDISGGGPDDVRRRIARESAQWGKVIKDANIRSEQ